MDTQFSFSPAPRKLLSFRGAGACLWWLPAVAWAVLIFALSAQPKFDFVPDSWQGDPLSLSAHFSEYVVLAVLLWLALRRTPRLAAHAWRAALAIALLYAASDEWHQAFVPGRVPDVRDWLADGAGAFVGLWLVSWLSVRRKRVKHR